MLPLDGVRVIAVEQYGAGPWGTLHLADLGAEVIKIENPSTGGDVARYVPPYRGERDSIYFQAFNRNKKSVTLDLTRPEGMAVFRRLVKTADAVVNNLRGDVPAKLGIDYQGLRDVNPAIVCCSLSSFGRHNFRASEPGYDYIMQAYAGWMSLTGEPDGPPTKTGLSLVDYSGGLLLALATVSGILRARLTGVGGDLDVSLFDAALSNLVYVGAWHLSRGYMPERTRYGSHPSQVPSQIFPTADGYIAIMCAKEKFWQELCRIVGHPEWAEDDRFRTFADRLQNREQVVALLEEVFKTKATAEWMELLRGRVPCGPVNDIAQALLDPLVQENGMIVEVDHPQFGRLRMVNTAIKVAGVQVEQRPGPALGEHTDAVLKELGYSEEEIASLRAKGIV